LPKGVFAWRNLSKWADFAPNRTFVLLETNSRFFSDDSFLFPFFIVEKKKGVVEMSDLRQKRGRRMGILNVVYRSTFCALLVIASTLVIVGVDTVAQTVRRNIKIDAKDRVEFHSGTTSKDQSGNPTDIIYGQLFKPAGDGPFPALVLLHDRLGLHITHKKWAERLVEWGYVALLVDSLGPRGLETAGGAANPLVRGEDAYGALNYLESLDFVDANRVGLIGWSHGGETALTAVSPGYEEFFNIKRKFKVAIAYYPSCPPGDFYTPVLVFFGDDDVLQRNFSRCKKAAAEKRAEGKPFEMKIYPGASHIFDYGFNSNWKGKPITYDPVAEKDAIKRVKAFLDKHF
jgi:dienelactone hydrolase